MRDGCGWGPGQGAWVRHCWAWLGGLSDLQVLLHYMLSPHEEGRGDAAMRQGSLKSMEQRPFIAHIFNARGVTDSSGCCKNTWERKLLLGGDSTDAGGGTCLDLAHSAFPGSIPGTPASIVRRSCEF